MDVIVTLRNYFARGIHLSMPFFLVFSLFSTSISAMETEVNQADLQEIEGSIVDIEKTLNPEELEKFAQEIEHNFKKDEQDKIRGRNRVLWSIPAAFPEDEFDKNIDNLHVAIPFYGKVSLGDGFSKWFRQVRGEIKKSAGVKEFCEPLHQIHQEFNDVVVQGDVEFKAASLSSQASEYKALLDKTGVKFDGTGMKNVYAPGAKFYEYLTGKNLIGLGLYRSDLNEIGFLAANIGSEYILFRDLKKAKLDKVKEFILANKDLCIDFIERLQNSVDDPKSRKKIEQELRTVVTQQCSLFIYNPFKKEIVLPIIKYLFIQRVIENFKIDKATYLDRNPDSMSAFVKNGENELVRSGVTPISLVTLSKYFVAPVAAFSEPSKMTLYHSMRQLKFMDKFFGNFQLLPSCCYSEKELKTGLPLKFYWYMASITGEALVLIASIKIIDKFFNNQLVKSLVAKPDELLEVLKEAKQFSSIENPNKEESDQIVACENKLEKEIEKAFSLNKTNFRNWVSAKRSTFAKIGVVGFCCFILPSIVVKAMPLLKNVIKSYWG